MLYKDLGFDMVKPCAECPFRSTTPVDNMGSATDLVDVFGKLSSGPGNTALHSCHKTDPRVTDGGFVEGYKGPVQHCGGLLLLMAKWKKPSVYMLEALKDGKLNGFKLAQNLKLVPTKIELFTKIRNWCNKNGADL